MSADPSNTALAMQPRDPRSREHASETEMARLSELAQLATTRSLGLTRPPTNNNNFVDPNFLFQSRRNDLQQQPDFASQGNPTLWVGATNHGQEFEFSHLFSPGHSHFTPRQMEVNPTHPQLLQTGGAVPTTEMFNSLLTYYLENNNPNKRKKEGHCTTKKRNKIAPEDVDQKRCSRNKLNQGSDNSSDNREEEDWENSSSDNEQLVEDGVTLEENDKVKTDVDIVPPIIEDIFIKHLKDETIKRWARRIFNFMYKSPEIHFKKKDIENGVKGKNKSISAALAKATFIQRKVHHGTPTIFALDRMKIEGVLFVFHFVRKNGSDLILLQESRDPSQNKNSDDV